MYDLIIVGGGPAGLAAAVHAVRKRLNVLVVSTDLGGRTNNRLALPGLENHRVIRGCELVDQFRRELEYLDFARRLETVAAITKTGDVFTVRTEGGAELAGRSVILATGSRVNPLNVPGEQEYYGRGVSYSAVCYAPLFIGKTATVIGDGARASRAMAELSQVASSVYWLVPTLSSIETRFARKVVANRLKVVVLAGHQIKAIQGNGYANSLLLVTPEEKETEISTDGIFIEFGLLANSESVRGTAARDHRGRVIVDHRNRTSCPGLFAAGDVTNAYAEQVLVAVGDGAKAALSAHEYLQPAL